MQLLAILDEYNVRFMASDKFVMSSCALDGNDDN